MTYNPDIHHRQSIRLSGFDYASAGVYYVTICVQGRECLFGEIVNSAMELNDAGRIVEKWWLELSSKFPAVELDEFTVMPNHFHGITHHVGAALCGRPPLCGHDGHPRWGAPTLGDVMDWFKTMTTNEYIRSVKQLGWPSFPGRLWQRNYYEHIVRSETELNDIRNYITSNPTKWADDTENPTLYSQGTL